MNTPSTRHNAPSTLTARRTDLPEDVVLSVRGVSKKFCRNLKRSMWYGIGELARDFFLPSRLWTHVTRHSSPVTTEGSPVTPHPSLRPDEFWALKDISFDLHHGESLGIIGMNGSGKSTLLRVLNAVFPPDAGEIRVRGRVGGLIALGAGMHPHLTGRENIYLNGAILGMSKNEIDAKFESIAAFSEIGDFLDAPLATYSSGMHVRLGFAVAIHGEPDILLVDEVLAVGDYSFVNKSLRYLAEYKKKAKAIIYISHNLEQVRNLCGRVIVLDKGGMVFEGGADEGVSSYQSLCERKKAASGSFEKLKGLGLAVHPSDSILVTSYKLASGDSLGMAEPLRLICEFVVRKEMVRPYFSFTVASEQGTQVIWKVSNDADGVEFPRLDRGQYRVSLTLNEHHLMPGRYFPLISVRDDETMETYMRGQSDWSFVVTPLSGIVARGLVHAVPVWDMQKL